MVSWFTTFAAQACGSNSFFGLVPWYKYIGVHQESITDPSTHKAITSCQVNSFDLLGSHSGILMILLAIVDDVLVIAGVVAVAYVIYAGIKYVMSQGSPDETAKAQSTLVNAVLGLALSLIAVTLVSYVGNRIGGANGTPAVATLDTSSLPQTPGTSSTVSAILSIVSQVVGALSLLVITIGGFRYVLSQGDPQATGKAKNTILYALVGLVVAVMAQVIVTFVIKRTT